MRKYPISSLLFYFKHFYFGNMKKTDTLFTKKLIASWCHTVPFMADISELFDWLNESSVAWDVVKYS